MFSERLSINTSTKTLNRSPAIAYNQVDFFLLLFLAVQNSSIGDLVTHSVTESLLLLPYKEKSQRLVTIETFDQSDDKA